MEQPYMLPILYCQYHASWCPDDLRSWCISRHGINKMIQNIPSLTSDKLSDDDQGFYARYDIAIPQWIDKSIS